MSEVKEVVVPDIGSFEAVDIIELNVASGDVVDVEDTLVTLESDKASMEIPSPYSGTIKELKVALNDKVSTGSVLLTMEIQDEQGVTPDKMSTQEKAEKDKQPEVAPAPPQNTAPEQGSIEEIRVPDIGGATDVTVIEVNVSVGDTVEDQDILVTLESDKASMELPITGSGVIRELKVKVGDKVSEGSLLALIERLARPTGAAATLSTDQPVSKAPASPVAAQTPSAVPAAQPSPSAVIPECDQGGATASQSIHASPVIRRYAYEFGVNLAEVTGTGRKNRILKQDIQSYIKARLREPAGAGSTLGVSAMPEIDFSAFGPTETQPLSRINKLSAAALHRNWVSIPHVTQFDECDITEMEAFRQQHKDQAKVQGFNLTPLVFLLKATVASLKAHPKFNASLAPNSEELILKQYYHIGFAADTPNGLVVPVIRDVDQKGLFDLAKELAELSQKAREGKLSPSEMQGSCFTISSLGGIGGTAFTPIINAPDVAILGVSKSQIKPVYQKGTNDFVPRLMLPLSLSYDHRVIDGALAARFITYYCQVLKDIRELLL